MKIKNLLPGVQKNVLLKNYTTFRIGGRAKYFFTAETKEDLIKAIKLAKKLKLPFFILGGGSNLLVSDKGFNGLVINFQFSPAFFQKGGVQKNTIVVGAGTKLAKLVKFGLEWAVGIPGAVGGAVYGNAGAFGKSMKDVIESIEVFDVKTEKIKIFKNKDCQFAYRNSIFKYANSSTLGLRPRGIRMGPCEFPNLIILSVKIKKRKSNLQKIKKYLEYRKKNQPLNLPSAGSVFKNPPGFFAGKLIEDCGLKGKRIGNVKISEKHANFIVNLGNTKANDVRRLINLVKAKVKKKFGIELEEEIQYLGLKNQKLKTKN